VTEPENSTGEAFGESKLQRVVQEHPSLPASELLQRLLFDLHNWQPPDAPQQDDITLIVMDFL